MVLLRLCFLLYQTGPSSFPPITWTKQNCSGTELPSSPRGGCVVVAHLFSWNPTLDLATTLLWWKGKDGTPALLAVPVSVPAPASAPTNCLLSRSAFLWTLIKSHVQAYFREILCFTFTLLNAPTKCFNWPVDKLLWDTSVLVLKLEKSNSITWIGWHTKKPAGQLI